MNPILCVESGWKFPSGSGEEVSKSVQWCIFTILQLSPLWEGRDPSFEK